MFKKNKVNIGLITTCLLLLFSCSEDLGNYNYTDINEVTISDIEESYTAIISEPFEIIPKVESTIGNDSDYEYEWTAINNIQNSDNRVTVLATTKNLQLSALTIAPAVYTVTYKIKDLKTDVVWTHKFELSVENTIFEGWMVLNDVNGEPRLDMISRIDDQYTPIYDVLGYVNSSLTLSGKPIDVYCYKYRSNLYGVYVTTEGNGTTRLDPDTFDWKVENRISFEFVSDVPTDFGIEFIEDALDYSGESYAYENGNVHYYNRVHGYNYGLPISKVAGEISTFESAPFIGVYYRYARILFDNTNKRFVRHNARSSECIEIPKPLSGALFDYNIGKDLLYMEGTPYNGAEVFALLHDTSDNKVFLARIGIKGAVSQKHYSEIPPAIAADMLQADHFAVSPQWGYVFYSLNNKVYQYDFGIQQSKLMLDKSGQEITNLKFEKRLRRDWDRQYYYNKLIVTSFDGSEGTFEIYDVPPVNGDLVLLQSYDGFGKIVSFSYRSR